MTYPTAVPERSDTVLVGETVYDTAGRVERVRSPKTYDGTNPIESKTEYDDAGRVTKSIENYRDGTPGPDDEDRVTEFTYTDDDQIKTVTAKVFGSTDQITRYVYGTAQGNPTPDVHRNNLLRAVIYPDSVNTPLNDADAAPLGNGAGSYDRVEMKYNRLGELTERKDQREAIHELTYDLLGRLTTDTIADPLPTGVDGDVRRVERTYEVRGMLSNVTSYDSTTGTLPVNVVNHIQMAYNDFGQLLTDYQDHDGPVDDTPGTGSPRASYAYEDGSDPDDVMGIRQKMLTYPNGREVHYLYADAGDINGISHYLSRITAISNDTTRDGTGSDDNVIAGYEYLGMGTVVRKDYPVPGIRLDYWGGVTEIYDGFDRFGRVAAQRWVDYSGTETDVFHIKHGYDRASNRRYADRQVYKSHSQTYTYDDLNRLDVFKTGLFNGNTSSPDTEAYWNLRKQDFNLDQLGNQLDIDTPEGIDYFKHTVDAGGANEYTSRKVKADTAKQPTSEDLFSVDSSANWENIGGAGDSFNIGSGDLTISAVLADNFDGHAEPDTRTIVLLGEEVGPSHIQTQVTIPSNPTALAGIVFGYKSPNDYWVKAVDFNSEGTVIYHIVDGVQQFIGIEEGDLGGAMLSLQLSGRRNSDAAAPALNLTNGFPSGRIGLFSNTANTTFSHFKVFLNQTTVDLAGRWINPARTDGTDGNAVTSTDQLRLNRPEMHEDMPILLDGVRLDQFEATFSVRPDSGTHVFAFVFNATDQSDYDMVELRYEAMAPTGFEVVDGGTRQLVTGTGDILNDPTPTSPDVVWYRVKYDGTSLTVKGQISNTGPPTDLSWDSVSASYTSTGGFDFAGGMIGFKAGAGSSVLIDDLTVKAKRGSTWVTEHVDHFDIDVNGYAEQDPKYDDAGNLAYDGKHAFTYDAWNRLVKVTKAYPDGAGSYTPGSVVGTMQYDGLGRRTVKAIQNSADLDMTYHYYYDGQSVIQTDNGSNYMLKQYVWGLQYIDELCQTAINLDPANADPLATYPENIAERFFYALQDANFNVLGVVGAGGYLAERYEYTPYGQRTVYSHGVVLPDIDGDGFVGIDDLNKVLLFWNQSSEAAQIADLNGDGVVGIHDLNIVNGPNWNLGTPPNDPLVTYPTLQSARRFKLVLFSGIDPGTTLCEVGHQGLFHDEEFGSQGGLINNRGRTLHPRFARFMQRDPAGYTDGFNLYEGLTSNPLNLLDPTGATVTGDLQAFTARTKAETRRNLQQTACRVLTNDRISGNLQHAVQIILTTPGLTDEQRLEAINNQIRGESKFLNAAGATQLALIQKELAATRLKIAAREAAFTIAGGIIFRGAALGVRLGASRLAGTGLGIATRRTAQAAVLSASLRLGSVPGASAGEVASLFGRSSVQIVPRAAGNAIGSGTGSGISNGAVLAQRSFRETFSKSGQNQLSRIAGQPIRTIDDLAGAIRSGVVSPGDVPINFITREGNAVILNTRTAEALNRAGVPRGSSAKFIERTGDEFFENLLNDQLGRNTLTIQGIPRAFSVGQ